MKITIAKDFTDTLGARYYTDGPYSGQAFREEILKEKYQEAKSNNEILEIDMDDCYGYPSSFLEEAFGGLVRCLKGENILETIKLISLDEPGLVEKITQYVNDEIERQNKQ